VVTSTTGGVTTGGCPPDDAGLDDGGTPCPDFQPSLDSPCPTEGQCCDYRYYWCDHNGGGRTIVDTYTCINGTWQ
jgi:hypothetical protein